MTTISVSSLFQPQTPDEWLSTLLADGNTLGLPATSWQSGAAVRTIMRIMGLELAKEDAFGVSLRAQGAFLDFAASGTVTFTDIDTDGNPQTIVLPVTPDPSIPAQNPSGAPGLLDTLASSVYNVIRGQATSASNVLYLANTSGTSLGTFQSGTFHVQNALTGATYSNQASFTLSPSSVLGTSVTAATATTPVAVTTSTAHGLSTGTVVFAQALGVVSDDFYMVTVTGANTLTLNGSIGVGSFPSTPPPAPNLFAAQIITFASDTVGPSGNAGVRNINQFITAAPKSFCTNLVTFSGANWQSNTSLAATCRAKLATLSPNGPQGAYLFFALAAYNLLQGLPVIPNVTLVSPIPAIVTLDGGAINRATISSNTAIGQVVTVIANPGGSVGGCLNQPITAATAASPIQITCAGHGLVTGDWGQVNGVQGLTGANGQWQVTRVDANNVTLNGSTGTGAYTANTGLLSGGDIYAVNAVLRAYSTPNGVTSTTVSANNVNAVIGATVYVPIAFVSDYITKMTAALTTYFSTFPIGGLNVDGQVNVLPIGTVEGLLFASGQSSGQFYTQSVTGVTINAVPLDLVLTSVGVAVLGTLGGIQVIGV